MALLSPKEAGKRIRTARRARRLTQYELAKLVGVPQSLVSYWETGRCPVSRFHLVAVARALRVAPDHLVVSTAPARTARDDTSKDTPAAGPVQRAAG